MPAFRLVPSKRFEEDFRNLPKQAQGQVLKALGRIQADPYRGHKLRGVSMGRWRYRVGDYRIRRHRAIVDCSPRSTSPEEVYRR